MPARAPDLRTQRIRLIHVARRDLKMAEDSYRAIVREHTNGRSDSSANCTLTELDAIIQHLKKCGFKVRNTKAKAAPSRALAKYPEAEKIRALWLFLHELGVVEDASEKALASYVKRMTKVEALQWLNGQQVYIVIEALKKWAMRFLPDRVRGLVDQVRGMQLAPMQAAALNSALSVAFNRMTFDPMRHAWELLQEAIAKPGVVQP